MSTKRNRSNEIRQRLGSFALSGERNIFGHRGVNCKFTRKLQRDRYPRVNRVLEVLTRGHRSPVKSPDVSAVPAAGPRLDIRRFSNITCADRRLVFSCMTPLSAGSTTVTAIRIVFFVRLAMQSIRNLACTRLYLNGYAVNYETCMYRVECD